MPSVSTDELRKIDAQIAALEAAEQQRIINKINAGEAVLLPPKVTVIGCPKAVPDEAKHDAQGRPIYYGTLTEDGRIDEGISVIVTGVPRPGRDADDAFISSPSPKSSESYYCEACDGRFPSRIHDCKPIVGNPKGPRPRSAQIQSEEPWHSLVVQTQAPNEANPAGAIREYRYQVAFGTVRVAELDGRIIGSALVAPNDDAKVAARKVIRECNSGFNSPLLNYPHLTIV
jgi:hypothetical protein